MDQGRYGEEKDREESSYQGSYGAQAESWVCPACETVNSQDKCVVCGYPNEPKVDNVKSEKKKRPCFVWAIAVCLMAVAFFVFSMQSKRNVAELPKDSNIGQIPEPEAVVQDVAGKYTHTLMADMLDWERIEDGVTGLYRDGTDSPVFGSEYQRQQIASVTFLASTEEAATDSWDVSQNQDGTVLAWVKPNGALYDLFIGAEGGVVAPEDCTCLFLDYINLRQIEFNDAFDTANVTSMSSMFDGCSSLSKLDVSNFDTANVTDMYAMFDNCNSLATLDVSGFDTTNVMDMGGMFGNCNSLTELDVSGFDTANVMSMYAMFYNCSHLSELDASHFDTSNVTNMGFMFCGCSNLTELDVSGFETAKVTNMYAMFDNCSNLTTLDVSGFDTTNVTDMGGMFGNCSSLTKLDVSSFDTANVTDMSHMFFRCERLTSLEVSHFDVNKVDMYGDFMGHGRTINGRPWEEFFRTQ